MKSIDKLKDFARKLVEIKAEAGRLSLYETMHALEGPVTKVGWEIARIIK